MCIINKAVVIAGLNVAERRPAREQQGNAGNAWRDSNRQGGEWQGWQGTTRHGKVK